MDNLELVKTAREILKYKTFYIWGSFGSLITKEFLETKFRQYPVYYTQKKKQEALCQCHGNVFGFDCIGLIKGILWGWNGDISKTSGGAKYSSNKVPDITANMAISMCQNVSTDFSKIQIGSVVWLKGHIGIYVGNNEVIESTPAWKGGVQLTKLSQRNWLRHGKLPWVVYK